MKRLSSSRLVTMVVDLVAIHLIPTLMVFACCFGIFAAMFGSVRGVGAPLTRCSLTTHRAWLQTPITNKDYLAWAIAFGGFVLESVADSQLRPFRHPSHRGMVCRAGVWGIVRHPNYLVRGRAACHPSQPC